MSIRVVGGGGRRRWSAAGGAAVSAVLAALAVLHPGAPVSQVDLNDGAVWLTSATALKLGRYNAQVEELNAGLAATSPALDVRQDAADVLLLEPGRVSVVDPASVTLVAHAAVPLDAQVWLGGGAVVVVQPGQGAVWARTVGTVGALDVEAEGPDLNLGAGGLAVATGSGAVVGAGVDGRVQRLEAPGGEVRDDGTLAAVPTTALDAVTAVGKEVVVLAGSRVHTRSGTVELAAHGTDLVLQQPGPAADHVLVAGRTALLEVPLDGGRVREHPTGGEGLPVAPVRVAGCAHGAWASATGSHLQLCPGRDAAVRDLEGVGAGDTLVFRVNRDVVVLNDVGDGRVWIPTDDPRLREPNWQEVVPDTEGEQEDPTSDSTESIQAVRQECGSQSAPPAAVDDTFGVRPGRTTVLPVIDNDASSECGVLAVSAHDPVPEDFGTLVPVHGGRALQLTAAPGATGTVRVTYTVTDGRGSTTPSTATLTLTAHPQDRDAPPVQVRSGAVVVEQGASATYDARPDFLDPDGDQLTFSEAAVTAGGTVRTRQDGLVTFESDGSALGRHTVRLLVSDGVHTVQGTLVVDIRPAGSLPPVIDPVHAVTHVGRPVVVRPLDAVRSLSGEPVRLAAVEEPPGVTVVSDLAAGTFTVTAARTGTYYVTFVVTAPPQQATGLARIDVREPPTRVSPPTAVLDVALLPLGGEVTIDPLANDVDPAGGVLVLQSVEAPPGLRAAVLHHELLRITSTRALVTPATLTYTVSNGTASATGEVLVRPLPASALQQPPVVPHVAASVRTGGVVTIPVLEGADDPDGDPLTLVRELVEPLGAGQGLMFVSGDVLRYQAPETPGEVRATFAVTDPAGNVTAGTVTVTVRASDAATKEPPRPRALTARVLAGETIRIPVPLTGIDADGDGVWLLGPADAPAKGRVVAVGADWMEYEALPGELGTDAFSYAVEDWVGQRAVATVQVGIAARTPTSAQVVSRNDDVTVRPGRTVEVRVLANDVETGGGELTLDPDLAVDGELSARVEGSRVVVQAPDHPAELNVAYLARNARGAQDSAVLTVHVSPDAPIAPPVARDVVVPATETVNRSSVEVDVLSVAENPSGPLSDLRVGVHPSAAAVATATASGSVVVTLVDRPQTVPYSVTSTDPEADGAASYAFITVPALGDFPPVRRPRAPALRVVAGQSLRISLAEQVQVAPGRTPRIADAKTVSATKSEGAPVVVDSRTVVYTPQRTYAGPASVSLEVADGEPGAPGTHRRVLTLPVTVLAAEDHPPTFSAAVLDVAPGEPTRVDLTAFTSAPVETAAGTDRYTYRLASPAPPWLRVSLDGADLTLSADPAVARGTVASLTVAIGYGSGATVAGRLDVRVVASSRPLARVLDHRVPDGVQGGESVVAVLAGAFNPFPTAPLEVVGAVVETPGAGTARVDGSRVVVRPAPGHVGPMVTRYRVRDVTGDPDREVEARITVTVRGRPDAPAAPRVVEVRDRAVVLAWDAPANNGDPITGYAVTAQPGALRTECPATTCTVTGLANDTEYTFTVTARNGVGESPSGPSSVPARPDTVPSAPGVPLVTRGDARLDVRWTAPENPGSPIRTYEVEISPAPADGPATVRTTATAHGFTGLTNGTAYTVRVRALNAAPTPGPWSAPSAPTRPARLPDAPASVTVTTGYQSSRTVTVAWQPPASDGGEPVVEYQVVVDGGTPLVVGGAERSVTFQAALGRRFDVAVQARTAVGWSAPAVAGGEVYGAPGPVTDLTAVDVSGQDAPFGEGRLRLRWSRPAVSGVEGQDVSRYRVVVDGSLRATVDHTGGSVEHLVTGLGGGRHHVEVVPVNVRDVAGPTTGTQAAVATVAQAVGFGPADTATAGEVTFSWSSGGDGGTPITGFRYRVQRDGVEGDLVGTQTGTSLTVPVVGTESQAIWVTVWAVNARGGSAPAEVGALGEPVPEPEPDPESEPEVPPATDGLEPEPGAGRLPDPDPEPEPEP